MRHLLWLLLVAAPLAYAQQSYDVTATMPLTTGSPSGCVLYLDGTAVDDPASPALCGQPVTYPGLISGDGTYDFTYTLVKGDGTQTAVSGVTTVSISTDVSDPVEGPGVSIECLDSSGNPITCPSHISITITPS